MSVDKKEQKALKAIKSNNKCKCEKCKRFFDKSVNGKNSNAKPVQKIEKKVVTTKGGKHEPGNLSHCVSLINDKLSQLNNKMEIMQVQLNSMYLKKYI